MAEPWTCESCRFYDPIQQRIFDMAANKEWTETREGRCRRQPPDAANASFIRTGWPLVLPVDWCGEWRGKGSDE